MITMSQAARFAWRIRKLSRMTRLMRFLTTALRAARFDTTIPKRG